MQQIFIKWQPAFNLGIPEIDTQHKSIIDLINALNKAFVNNVTNDKIGEILDDMSEYADRHFKTEEKYFEKSNFPLMKEHKVQHEYFKTRVKDFKDQFYKGKPVTFRLMKFLHSWWTNHILDSDREYVEIVKSSIL
ncbi:MAG: bacteriohemerythrin [Bacteroidales bacterium]|nr:bacteriohemerythrin [Bacteroidales bacterium]